MPATNTPRKAAEKATRSTRTATDTAKQSAATAATASTAGTAGKVKGSTKRAVAGARATRAAKAGLVEDARQIAEEAGSDSAEDIIAEVEAMHYQVEVNKRALSVSALTQTLNDRWDNGWRLAHLLEQRGNTVLVFEKRS